MEHLWQVLLRAAGDAGEPLSCEDCFVLLDYLAELLADGYAADEVLNAAERHLSRCPDCEGEYRDALAVFRLSLWKRAQPR